MDDPVLRGRIIAVGISVVIAGLLFWVMARKTSETADVDSDAHRKILESGCAAGGREPGTPEFDACVALAKKKCGGGGGVARNLATCARAVASEEF